MENYYFYTDANGNKQGPYSIRALQYQANEGKITSATPLETEDKRPAGLAGQFLSSGQWRFDFASHLWVCKLCCIIVWVAAIALGLVATFWGFQTFGKASELPDSLAAGARFGAFIGVVCTWGYCAFCVVVTHLLCTWSLITSKAAQLYVENCDKK